MKLGNILNAKEMIFRSKATAQKYEQKRRKMGETKESAAEGKRIDRLIDSTLIVFENLWEKYEKKQTQIASQLLKKVESKPDDFKRKFLLKHKIEPKVVEKLLAKPKKKGGLFGLFSKG